MLKDALPDLVLLDWMLPGQFGPRVREGAARRRAHARAADHHGDGAHRRGRQGRRPRGVGRRLRDQAVLAARAQGARSRRCCGGARPRPRRSRSTSASLRARSRDASRDRRRQDRRSSDRPNSGCCASSSRGRSACIRARSSWTRCGATRSTSRSAPSTSTSAGCALALEPFGQDATDRDGARQRLPARGAALKRYAPPL